MRKKTPAPYFDYRRKISNPTQLSELSKLCVDWGLDMPDVCWRLITDGIAREKKKRDDIEKLREQNKR